MAHLAVFVLYLLWFSIVFAVVVLWSVALSDINKCRARKGAFSALQLSLIAAAVSVAAAAALFTANAVVRHGWLEAAGPKAVAVALPAKTECEIPSFTYSFGLDGANTPQNCAARTGER